jgi:hypothetical protein
MKHTDRSAPLFFTRKAIRNLTILSIMAISLLQGTTVHAAGNVLQTAALLTMSTEYHGCIATNIGTTNIPSLKVELINVQNGSVLETNTFTNIPPGVLNEVDDFALALNTVAFCRFTGASSKKLRANLSVFFPTNGDFDTISLSEAH